MRPWSWLAHLSKGIQRLENTMASRLRSLLLLRTALLGVLICCGSNPLAAQSMIGQAETRGCTPSATTRNVLSHVPPFFRGLEHIPRNAIRPENLKWELPIVSATGLLIAEADQPAAKRIQSQSLQHLAREWSNIGLASEFGTAGAVWGIGCFDHKPLLRDNGLTVLTAMGTAVIEDLVLKAAFDRQYPYATGSHGTFWGGGGSFPSGHSEMSFAFAAAIAHRYPHKRWIKWAAFGLAAGVALSRYPAKKHYLSDILAGSTLGYVTGAFVAEH